MTADRTARSNLVAAPARVDIDAAAVIEIARSWTSALPCISLATSGLLQPHAPSVERSTGSDICHIKADRQLAVSARARQTSSPYCNTLELLELSGGLDTGGQRAGS